MTNEEQGVGPVSLRAILKDERVAVYQDPQNHLHIYYCGFYRTAMSFGFFRDAEVSLFETDDFLEIRSMGQGVMRFPLAHDLHISKVEEVQVVQQDAVVEEDWPEMLGEKN